MDWPASTPASWSPAVEESVMICQLLTAAAEQGEESKASEHRGGRLRDSDEGEADAVEADGAVKAAGSYGVADEQPASADAVGGELEGGRGAQIHPVN